MKVLTLHVIVSPIQDRQASAHLFAHMAPDGEQQEHGVLHSR